MALPMCKLYTVADFGEGLVRERVSHEAMLEWWKLGQDGGLMVLVEESERASRRGNPIGEERLSAWWCWQLATLNLAAGNLAAGNLAAGRVGLTTSS